MGKKHNFDTVMRKVIKRGWKKGKINRAKNKKRRVFAVIASKD